MHADTSLNAHCYCMFNQANRIDHCAVKTILLNIFQGILRRSNMWYRFSVNIISKNGNMRAHPNDFNFAEASTETQLTFDLCVIFASSVFTWTQACSYVMHGKMLDGLFEMCRGLPSFRNILSCGGSTCTIGHVRMSMSTDT